MTKQATGSVMVIGGGIAGIQSALDLAEGGFFVHLVEKTPAIGGVMSALDKTFPTNDCAMCILSPKLVEVGRHINIRLHTCTDVEKIDGDAGDFHVTLRKTPRFIDPNACTACGDCGAVCPVVRPSIFDMGMSVRKAAYKLYAQAVPSSFVIEKIDKAPCRAACPAHLNVQGYVQMIKEGKYREAIEIIMRDLPFPGILGRVCPHTCEKSCRRLEVDEPIAIRELKRFAADHTDLNDIPIPPITARDEKVAIIGSGPAGLTAAYFLALDGYQVSVYEAMPEAGGMMRYGIPEHRLPRSVLDAEINNLKRYGIEIHTNTKIGKDLTVEELRQHGAQAVFLATGAWKGLRLGIPGEEASGVVDVTTFLRDVHLGNLKKISGKAVIIGGGHSALDGARVALRLGADESHILYRRSKTEMPAEAEEVEEAEKEGIKIHFLAAPIKINQENDVVTGIECIRTRLTEADAGGRRRPVPIEGSEFTIAADHIIAAIGQEPDLDFLGMEPLINISKRNLPDVNPETLQTNIDYIFAGGDIVTGPATVIKAVEAGKRAAKYIAEYLRGEALPTRQPEIPPTGENWIKIPDNEPVRHRIKSVTLPVEESLSGFKEVNLSADEQSVKEEASRCLNCGGCCECYECLKACKSGAVTLNTHAQQVEILSVDVGAVIITPGAESFNPGAMDIYGYKTLPNVITAREFERILSASGPFEGHLIRPSDHSQPKKIAWLQCVGSRNIREDAHGYCSSVCCMYAIKEAVIAKEHAEGELDTAIFFMDMRTHGKGFEETYNRARDEQGVRFIRARFHSIDPVKGSDDLKLTYLTDDGELKREHFSMVVLSTGLEITQSLHSLSKTLGVESDSDNFIRTQAFSPVKTSRQGLFAAGASSGPKDIPQSVTEASSAAALAGALLCSARNTLTKEKHIPTERDITGERPRIGVFVCQCGINIGGIVNVPAVRDYAATLPYVEFVMDNLYTCSQDAQENIAKIINEKGLNRVVVAACTPKTHEPLFQETLVDTGLNKYVFEMTNIRNQCSWVHRDNPELATQKAKDLVRMAIAKVALMEPLKETDLEVDQRVLVVGGGISGMVAAKTLSSQGYHVYLVEQSGSLGGNAQFLSKTWNGEDVQGRLSELIQSVETDSDIEVFKNTVLSNVDGFVGNFKTTLSHDGAQAVVEHGVAIIATGGKEYIPDEYLYGKDPRVVTHMELDRMFMAKDDKLKGVKTAVFIQCVGSRVPERPYCSRLCCTHTMKSAILLKEMDPDTRVYILYRDIRTYGQREELYKEARRLGVIFIRYSLEKRPVVNQSDGSISVTINDHILKRNIQIDSDLVILASGVVPNGSESLAQMFKLSVNEYGFFMEAHAKLRPVDFATDGVFLAGMAHYPKPIEESIAQAQAAVSRAVTLLAKKKVRLSGTVAQSTPVSCSSCGVCVDICPYSAPSFIKDGPFTGRAEINPALCKGCGLCVASCRSGALNLKGFGTDQIMAMINQL